MIKKIQKIYIDGIDKCGKDTIVPYVNEMTNYSYFVCSRSIISVMAYNEIHRKMTFEENLKKYDLSNENDALYVLINVNEEDWKVRCKQTNEPKIDYKTNNEIFLKYHDEMYKKCFCLRFSSSIYTPYEIASEIAKWLKQYEKRFE